MTLVEGDAKIARRQHAVLVDDNHLGDQVRLVHGLAGARSGDAVLHRSRDHLLSSIVLPRLSSGGTRVPFVDLDKLLPGNSEIALLKCDIEGAELAVLENYAELLHRVRVAVFELHDNLCDTSRCKQLLAAYGFTGQHEVVADAVSTIYTTWR
jgi:FkbM family methyltransferase